MNLRTILLATDLTEWSDAATELAIALAETRGARLLAVHVLPGQPTAHLGPYYSALSDPKVAPLARELAAITPAAGRATCEHRLLEGDAGKEIVTVAAAEHVDVIVLGTRARSTAQRCLLGSVAEHVLSRASCAVFVCRSPVKP